MGIPRFFKIPRHRIFNYQPIYYNPEQEDRKARIEMIKREMGVKNEDGDFKTSIQRGSIKNFYHKVSKERKQSNLRLVLIIVFLLFVAYLILYK